VKIYTTPRNLLRSLQNSYNSDSSSHGEQSTANHSSSSSPDQQHKELGESSYEMHSQHSASKAEEKDENGTIDLQAGGTRTATEAFPDEDNSGSSSAEVDNLSCKASLEVECKQSGVCVTGSRGNTRKHRAKLTFLLSLIVVVLAIIAALIRIDSYDDFEGLVPT
jgi:cobalamin biosynthesis Mg chelatase CobN